MFNTDLIHFLQQFDSPILFWFMALISILGTIPVILTIVLGITFGIDFKKGLVLTNIIAWTALSSFVLKQQIDFPRPMDVDATVKDKYFESSNSDLSAIQPTAFFESFSNELLEQTRNDEWDNYGFPSGHAAIQVALWMSLVFLFKKRWIAKVGATIVFLTLISRMYLGHHFLGDVLGGAILGLLISTLLIMLVKRSNYLSEISYQFSSFAILWAPAFLIPFAHYVPLWILGSMVGLNVSAILIILQKNFPVFHVILWKRVLSALIALLFILCSVYLNMSIDYTASAFLELLIVSVINFLLIIGAVAISNHFHLIRFRF